MRQKAAQVFSDGYREYDEWYDRHPGLFNAEIDALNCGSLSGLGIEIGVGTGRFASHLHADCGLDPAFNALCLARRRSIKVVQAVGEQVPFRNETFHFALIVLTLSFVDNPGLVLAETRRILRPGGILALAVIDRDSVWGRRTMEKSSQSRFLKYARLFTAGEARELLLKTGWEIISARQTLFRAPENTASAEMARDGYGKGGFVVFRAQKTAPESKRP